MRKKGKKDLLQERGGVRVFLYVNQLQTILVNSSGTRNESESFIYGVLCFFLLNAVIISN
jgi:hypothetical protein